MSKQKTKKALEKRVKITAKGKVIRRHQFAAGHLKRNKSKSALESHKKAQGFFAGEIKAIKRMLSI